MDKRAWTTSRSPASVRDPVTAAACHWAGRGFPPGGYEGPAPPGDHPLRPLLGSASGAGEGRSRALELAAGWLRRNRALEEPCRLMRRAGLRPVAVKGWDLSQSVYPFLGARPMGDVDLMVRPSQLRRAELAFTSLGWNALCPGRPLLTSGTVSELKLVSPEGILVELHTHSFYFPALFPGRLPDSLYEPCRRLEPGLGAPSWPATLMMLLVHALTESENIPRQWVDIAAACGKLSGGGGWPELCLWLSRSGLGPAAGKMLAAAAEAGAPVPESVPSALSACPDRSRILAALRYRRGAPTLLAALLGGWRGAGLGAAQLYRILFGGGPLRRR